MNAVSPPMPHAPIRGVDEAEDSDGYEASIYDGGEQRPQCS